ncbi:hypothetical protein PgNI_11195 [Pyricularia grisea]|uniref:Uncharacterized protein n=1 Tax=Pyricularia grisea TaxID=148305 RepID=A0A6P8APE4_PYRGI|nr:hypothetical protein PgNI_11195 [Pyricularia grisea]TLD03896.1 hypothetical protein PgNI_11195 [Pyricularia grisea]
MFPHGLGSLLTTFKESLDLGCERRVDVDRHRSVGQPTDGLVEVGRDAGNHRHEVRQGHDELLAGLLRDTEELSALEEVDQGHRHGIEESKRDHECAGILFPKLSFTTFVSLGHFQKENKGSPKGSYLEQKRAITISKLSSKIAIPSKLLNGMVKRVQPVDKELRPREHLVVAAPLERESRTDSWVALSSWAEMLEPSSSELRRLIEYTTLEMLEAFAMELLREPILRRPR